MFTTSNLTHAGYATLFAIGVVLIVSATQKLRTPHRWLEDVSAYQVFPSPRLASVAAWAVVLLELGIGTVLILQLFPKEAALTATLLFCAFLIVVVITMARRQSVSCGCFGELFGESRAGKQTITRLIVLAGAAGLTFTYFSSTQSQSPAEAADRVASGLAFGTPLAILFFLTELIGQTLQLSRSKPGVDIASTREMTS